MPSLKSHLPLIRADGSAEALPPRAPMFGRSIILLARELCLFERLDTAKGLKPRAAMAAARIHADTAAPYQRSGSLITRHGPHFGIWWWDAEWVAHRIEEAGLDPAARILPEPMARASTPDGWRVVKASTGYEAQLWRGGFLMADLWRRKPFDQQAFENFVRVQPDQAGADQAVLMAQDPPYTLTSPYRRTLVSDWTPERTTQMAAAAAAVFLLGLAGYFAGQAIGLNRSAQRMEIEAAVMKAALPKTKAGEVGGLAAVKRAFDAPDPMVMLESAQAVIEPYGVKLIAFDVNREKARLILSTDAVDDLEAIAAELEASPNFSQVRPNLDRDKQRLVIDMIPAGAQVKTKAAPKAAADELVSLD